MNELKSKILEKFEEDNLGLILKNLDRIKLSENELVNVKLAIVELAEGDIKTMKRLIKLANRNPQEILFAYQKHIEFQSSKNDIIIDQNKKITWINFDPQSNRCKKVDNFVKPVQPLFDKLEINCERLCCGVEAFNFLPETIKSASIKSGVADLESKFNILIHQIENIEEDVVICEGLNQLFHKSVFLKLLDHIKCNI